MSPQWGEGQDISHEGSKKRAYRMQCGSPVEDPRLFVTIFEASVQPVKEPQLRPIPQSAPRIQAVVSIALDTLVSSPVDGGVLTMLVMGFWGQGWLSKWAPGGVHLCA